MTPGTCSECPAPATTDVYAGWTRIGDHWLMQTAPMCDRCAGEDARARAEARAS